MERELDLPIVILPPDLQKIAKEMALKEWEDVFKKYPKFAEEYEPTGVFIVFGYLGLAKGTDEEVVERVLAHEWIHFLIWERINFKFCAGLDKLIHAIYDDPLMLEIRSENIL